MMWNKAREKRTRRIRSVRILGSSLIYRTDSMMAVLVQAGLRQWDHRWTYLKRLQTAVCLVFMASFLSHSQVGSSNPEGGVVVDGSATISSPSPTTLQIDQQTQVVIIDWSSFNIAANELTQFIQPGSSALAVNRIGGNDPSQILGSLLANGRIVLINGNGIVFGPNAKINTGSFVATTSDASNEDIMSGKAAFDKAGNPNAMIINEGSITASSGLVGLIAPAVRNDGIITAKLGSVTLGASNIFALDFTGDGLISFPLDANVVARAIDENGKPVEALVVNNGKIEGATVMLTARAARDLVTHVISMGGTIAATSVHQDGGNVILDGGDGGVLVNGTITASGTTGGTITVKGGDITLAGAKLDASGTQGGGTIKVGDWSSNSVKVDAASKLSASAMENGNGGNISVISADTQFAGQADARGGLYGGNGGLVETSGHSLDIAGALIDTSAVAGNAGTWLLDPDDYVINAAQAATIVTNLGTGNVTIMTTFAGSGGNGDIFVNAPIVWSSAFSLTLSACRNININANITNTAGADVILRADNSATGIGTVAFGGGMISTSGMVSIFYNPSGNNNSTVNAFSYASPTNYSGNVTGGAALYAYMLVNTVYDLQNMQNNLSGTYALGGDIDASVTATWNAGAGFIPIGAATGFPTPSGTPFTGIFYGQNYAISNLTINRPGQDYVGLFGLIGASAVIRDVGLIDAHITGGQEFVGGLVGYNQFGTIVGSYVTGTVTGAASGSVDVGYVGGLVGLNKGTITQSYADATVSGHNYVGGLVGSNHGTVLYSYALGNVSGNDSVGGLAGYNWISSGFGIITQTYSTGLVAGVTSVGALVGFNDNGTVSQSYWDATINSIGGLGGNSGGSFSATGLATSAFYSLSNFVGWSFGTTVNEAGCAAGTAACWVIVDANGTLNNAGGAAGATRPFLLSEYSSTISNAHQLQLMALNLAGNYTLGRNIDLGPALSSASGMWGTAGFVPIGYAAGDPNPFSITPFTGSFDGQNHSISNLTIDRSASDYVGLFGYATGSIKNLTLINPHVTGNFSVGSLAGFSSGAIQNVAVTGGIVSSSHYYIGGLIGWNQGSVTNASYVGTVAGGDVVGGLIGWNDSGTVSNSHATVTVTGNNYLGGLVGYNGSHTGTTTTISNSYASGSVTGNLYVGGLVGQNNNSGVISNSHASTTVIGNSDVGGLVGINCGTPSSCGWAGAAGSIVNSYATGSVTGNTEVGGLVGYNDAGASISLSYATGVVYGSLYHIGGLAGYNAGTISDSHATGTVTGPATVDVVGGLVGWNNGGTITNSYAFGAITGRNYLGGLVGYNTAGSVTGSYASGNVSGNQYIGGLLGYGISGSITNSYATGTINGVAWVGGLIGWTDGSISGSHATGDVSGVRYVGGLIGELGHAYVSGGVGSGSVTNSYATGDVSASQNYAGGLIGQSWGSVTYSWASGDVSGGDRVGGLIGVNEIFSYTANSYATGDVTGTGAAGNEWIGGLAGVNAGIITLSYATGDVYAPSSYYVGGLVGYNWCCRLGSYAEISLSYATGNVTGFQSVGGLVGQNESTGANSSTVVTQSYATGTVTGPQDVGGLVGQNNNATITQSYATGNVSASTYNPGGLVGYNAPGGVISYSYATGNVSLIGGAQWAGGFVGWNNGSITQSYSTGLVSGPAGQFVGGFAGNSGSGTITLSYWDTQTSGHSNGLGTGPAAPGLIGQTTAQLKNGALPNGFDPVFWGLFSSNSYPCLLWQAACLHVITYVVGDSSSTYGTLATLGTITLSGVLAGDAANVMAVTTIYDSLNSAVALSAALNAGTYTVAVTGLTGSAASNYIISSAGNHNGILTVNPAPLIVAVNDASRLYGDANPTFSATVTGLVLGQDASVLGLSFSTLATMFSNVGSYAITLTGMSNPNYYIQSSTNGMLAINPAPLVVAVNDASRLYGDANPAFSATVTGLVLGQDASVLGLSFSTLATIFSNVGNYAISVTGLTNSNYYIQSSTNGTLTINPAPLVVAVNDASRLYGDANPAFSATVTGLVLGQDASVLGLNFSTLATIFSNVGNYGISVTGLTNSNYYIQSSTNGTLTINPAPLVVAVNDASRLYGDANPAFGATVTGLKLGQDASVLGLSFSTLATIFSNVGNYAITLTGMTNSNYYIQSSTNGTLKINPAPLVVAVNDASRVYGDANPAFGATVTGLKLGQDASVLGLSFSTLATLFSNVGNYAITLTGMTNSNYYIQSSTNGTLTINPAPLVVAVNDASRLYGDANPNFSATVTGLKLGQDAGVLGLSFSTLATIFSDVGNYAITVSGITNSNYYIQGSTNGTLTINPAPLYVAVNDASRLFYDNNPEFSATITGFVLGQDASVLSGLTFGTSATLTSLPGAYAIVALGGTAKNYVIVSRLNGTLTILPRIREDAPQVMATLRCAGTAGRDQDDGNASCDFDPHFDGWPLQVDLGELPVSNNGNIACAVAGALIDCRKRVMVH